MSQDWSLLELEEFLGQEDWLTADAITQTLLLQGVGRESEGWLTPQSIAHLPCKLLHEIDYLWVQASHGHFGFSVQYDLYQSLTRTDAHQFCSEVGWLILSARPLAFFKFYDFLNFSLDAPKGHLPALWYWKLSWIDSLRMGGFGTGRGAGFADFTMLDVLMLRLSRCSQL